MNAKELIRKKRDGGRLAADELRFIALGAADESIPAYQLTALLMAIFFQGLDPDETVLLTEAMRDSGDRLRFDVAADKHSTGGVGDKVSFLVAPLVAAAGVPVPMISGRSLGHTGGTLDKLESIAGLRTDLSPDEVRAQVEAVGLCIAAQGSRLAPADKVFYALRDSASIVESIPLIVASILSKKAAAGIRALALDVKYGDGAFMPDPVQGRRLAEALVSVAAKLGIRTRAYLTPMDRVLGRTAGNALEIVESIQLLRRDTRSADLEDLTLELGAGMLELAGATADRASGRERLISLWDSGAGLERLTRCVEAQGGDPDLIAHPERLPHSKRVQEVRASRSGRFAGLRARPVGEWITAAGGGRLHRDQSIDAAVGVEIVRSLGEEIRAGDIVFRLHTSESGGGAVDGAAASAWILSEDEAPARSRWVLETIGPSPDA